MVGYVVHVLADNLPAYSLVLVSLQCVHANTVSEHANTCIHVCVCMYVYVYVHNYVDVWRKHRLCIHKHSACV